MTTIRSYKSAHQGVVKEVIEKILDIDGNLTDNDVKPTPSSCNGMDVQLSEAARLVFPYAVECKRVVKPNIFAAYQQAMDNCGNLTPIVVVRLSNTKPVSVLKKPLYVATREKPNYPDIIIKDFYNGKRNVPSGLFDQLVLAHTFLREKPHALKIGKQTKSGEHEYLYVYRLQYFIDDVAGRYWSAKNYIAHAC